jgi:hypothetical protein
MTETDPKPAPKKFSILNIREWIHTAELVQSSRELTPKDFDKNADDVLVVAVLANLPVMRMAPPVGRVRMIVSNQSVSKPVFDMPVAAISKMGHTLEYHRLRAAVRDVLVQYEIEIPELTHDKPDFKDGGVILDPEVDVERERFVKALLTLRDAAADRSQLWNLALPILIRDGDRFTIELVDTDDLESVTIHAYAARPVM